MGAPFVKFPIEILMAKDLSLTARIVWAYLRHRQGGNLESWPSLPTIGDDLGFSKSSAGRAVAELELVGLLIVIPPAKTGRGHHSKYTIKGPSADRLEREKVHNTQKKGPPVGSNKNQGTRANNTCPPDGNGHLDFDLFWTAYPRKVKKPRALKAWQKINPDQGLFERIIAALELHKKSEQWQRDNGKFIPYPATWLNDESWNDEIEIPQDQDENRFGTHEASAETIAALEAQGV